MVRYGGPVVQGRGGGGHRGVAAAWRSRGAGAAPVTGALAVGRGPFACPGAETAAARVRTQSAKRGMAHARDESAALSLPARRDVAPGLHRTGVAGR